MVRVWRGFNGKSVLVVVFAAGTFSEPVLPVVPVVQVLPVLPVLSVLPVLPVLPKLGAPTSSKAHSSWVLEGTLASLAGSVGPPRAAPPV